jgi:hypothetical protein
MSFAMLPGELVDLILLSLKDSAKDSRACSLVCRAWARWTRHNLFHHIDLSFTEDNCTKLLALVRGSPKAASYIRTIGWYIVTGANSNVPSDSELASALLHCLFSLSEAQGVTHKIFFDLRARIAQYILDLLEYTPGIVGYVESVRWHCGDGLDDWHSDSTRSLASKLAGAKTLTLDQSRNYPSSRPIPSQALEQLFSATHITELNLSRVKFHSGSDFLQLVHACTALEKLNCSKSKWAETSDDHELFLLAAPPLRFITFSEFSDLADVTVRWLLTQQNPLQLEELVAPTLMPSSFNELLRRCAATIQSLNFWGQSIGLLHVTAYSL